MTKCSSETDNRSRGAIRNIRKVAFVSHADKDSASRGVQDVSEPPKDTVLIVFRILVPPGIEMAVDGLGSEGPGGHDRHPFDIAVCAFSNMHPVLSGR